MPPTQWSRIGRKGHDRLVCHLSAARYSVWSGAIDPRSGGAREVFILRMVEGMSTEEVGDHVSLLPPEM